MKIDKIELKNFQSHKETIIELSPYVNVITGPTDSGKSSIWRALRKVFKDLPKGSFFVRRGTKECNITIYLDNGNIIERGVEVSKGKTIKNFYKINDDQEFINYGKSIPLEVRQASEMSTIDFSELPVDLNFQDQYEPPLLLKDTPSVRAKVIGKIIGTDLLDRAFQSAKLDQRRKSTTYSDLDTTLKELKESLIQFQGLDEVGERVVKVKEKINFLEELEEEHNRLSSLLSNWHECDKELKELRELNVLLKETKEMGEDLRKLQKDKDICFLLKTYLEKEDTLVALKNKMKFFEEIDKIDTKIELLVDIESQLSLLKDVSIRCQENSNSIYGAQESLAEFCDEQWKATVEFKKLLHKMKKCPVCYSDLTQEKIDRIASD